MKISQAGSKTTKSLTFLISCAILFSGSNAFAALAPSPSPSPTPSQGATDIPKVAPVYPDTKVPLIKSITTSAETIDGQFNFGLQMVVRIHRNTLTSASVVLSPKTLNAVAVDPIFQAPCTKFNNISLATLTPSGDLSSLQSRVLDGDWYLETHVFTSTTRLPAGQDICPGQYVITSINLIDAAKHTLTISANLASTASISSTANRSTTTVSGTTPAKSNYNDTPAQTSNIWEKYLELAACPQAVNVNPIVTVVPGKTTIVNGKTQTTPSTTKTETPTTPAALRTTCDHTADFAKTYLSVVASTAMGGAGETKSNGSTLLPVVDYASKTKTAIDENASMKSQLAVLTKQVDGLKRTIEIYKTGGLPPAEPTTEGGLAVVDYQAKAKALQAKVTELTKQLKALKGGSTAKKPTTVKKPTTTAPKITTGNKPNGGYQAPNPRASGSNSGANPQRTRSRSGSNRSSNGSRSGSNQGNSIRSATPKPSVR